MELVDDSSWDADASDTVGVECRYCCYVNTTDIVCRVCVEAVLGNELEPSLSGTRFLVGS